MTAETLRPLARSLVPLLDETLSGYLLRLAYRLCIDPGRLAKLTGLTRGQSADTTIVRLAMNPVFRLDDKTRSQFTEVTRLTPGEVDGLLLEPLGKRYGPLDPQYSKVPASSRIIAHNPWVFTEAIRFCPECLAGTGSEIERLHGGAWRRSWRLPVVFACPQHQRLLLDRCPECGGLVHAGGQTSMIARLNDDELHPAQCRATPARQVGRSSPACGADLGQPAGNRLRALSPQTRRAVYALQNRFTQLLAADGPTTTGSVGWSVPVAQYFMDLRAVTTLIFMTWPEARPHAATPTLAEALDVEARQRHERYLERRAAPGKTQAARAYSDPPADPLVAAAVFDIADRFLRSPDENAAAALLSPLAAEARYAHQPLSYSVRRAAGTSFPLQVVLLTHRRQASLRDNITEMIERNEGLTRC
jgi:hypothetical protein